MENNSDNKLLKTFKTLMLAEMAINYLHVKNRFDFKWRDRLPDEEKKFLNDLVLKMAGIETPENK